MTTLSFIVILCLHFYQSGWINLVILEEDKDLVVDRVKMLLIF